MSWMDIKRRWRSHQWTAMSKIADEIRDGKTISRHGADGSSLRALLEILENRKTPYLMICVPDVGFLVGRHYPGDMTATKDYAARLMAMTNVIQTETPKNG